MSKPVTLEFVGDDGKLITSFNNLQKKANESEEKFSGTANKVSEHTDKIGGALTGMASKAVAFGATIAGVFAVDKIIDFGKEAIQGALDMQAATRVTEQVIKTTGGAAGVTAQHVDELSTKLSNLSGVDDDVIHSADNLLLTFTAVQNKAGEGNNIFDRATGSVLDMATAFHEDANSAAIQLGKALNDPIAGATALRRVGVQLTEQQQDQIKTFMKSGNVLGAQKIILDELAKETGGAAAAAADPWKRFTVVVENLQKEIGAKLLPYLTPLVTKLANELPKALDYATTAGRFLAGVWDTLVGGFQNPDAKFGPTVGLFERILLTIGALTSKGITFLKAAWDDLVGGFQNPEAKFGPTVSIFDRIFLSIGAFIGQVVGFVQQNPIPVLAAAATVLAVVVGVALVGAVQALIASLAVLFSPIVLIVAAIALLVGAVVYAYENFESFRNVVDAVIKFAEAQFQHLADFGRQIWPQVQEAAEHTFNAIRDVINAVLTVVRVLWDTFGQDIIRIAKGYWQIIQSVVEMAIGVVSNTIRLVLAIINGDWGKAWDALKGIVSSVFEGVKGIVSGAGNVLAGIVSGIGTAIGKAASGMFDGIKEAFRAVINWVIGKWNGLSFTTPKVHIPGTDSDVGGDKISVPQIPLLAKGGTALEAGLSIVGENGPEFAFLPKGATVQPPSTDLVSKVLARALTANRTSGGINSGQAPAPASTPSTGDSNQGSSTVWNVSVTPLSVDMDETDLVRTLKNVELLHNV
jgi:phage-related protein